MRHGPRKLEVRIEYEVVVSTTELNEEVKEWKTWRNVLAAITDRRGQEMFDAGQRFAETETRFQFAYADVKDITEKMRLRWDGRNYDIKSILIDHARKEGILVVAVRQD